MTTEVDRAAINASDPALQPDESISAALFLVNRCRWYSDDEMFDLVTNGLPAVQRVYRCFEEGEGYLRSCFLSAKGIAIAYSNLVRLGVDLPPLHYWVY